jgi:hypothetical protein
MPPTKRRVINIKKRRRNRRRKINYKNPQFPILSSIGLPKQKVVKMRYCERTTINAPAAGVVQAAFYGANDTYDPRQATGGHQPYGHDQWSQFYNHYTVIGSIINADFSVDASSASYRPNVLCGVYLADDQSVSTDPELLIETGKSNWASVSQYTNRGSDSVRISNTFSAKKYYNVQNMKDNFDRLGAATNSPPGEKAQYCVWVAAQDAATDPILMNVLIVIDYIVIFSEPKELIGS